MTSLEYIAGFFDGEGSISIYRATVKKPNGFLMTVTISQKVENAAVLIELKERYGGHLGTRRNSETNPRWCDVLQWCVSLRKAERFLRDIQPFSIVKKRHIEVALAFMDQRRPQARPWKGKTTGLWSGDEFSKTMRDLNGRAPSDRTQ